MGQEFPATAHRRARWAGRILLQQPGTLQFAAGQDHPISPLDLLAN
jgi:hypothetical protein